MMNREELTARILEWIDGQERSAGLFETPIEGLMALCHECPYPIEAVVYEPLVCLILQGEKATSSGDHRVVFGPGESLGVSHRLPVMSRVSKASKRNPYVAVVQTLDVHLLQRLEAELGRSPEVRRGARALQVGQASADMIDAVGRLFNLVHRPAEIAVMAPLIRKEIHFRLMMEGHSDTLRQLLRRGSHADRIALAIGRIKHGYRAPIKVPELARDIGMSASLFYSQFKALTATTPLQYQKDLRLIEARRILTEIGETVSETAFKVGYESPTQFSREYSRKFGEPPAKTRESAGQHASMG